MIKLLLKLKMQVRAHMAGIICSQQPEVQDEQIKLIIMNHQLREILMVVLWDQSMQLDIQE